MIGTPSSVTWPSITCDPFFQVGIIADSDKEEGSVDAFRLHFLDRVQGRFTKPNFATFRINTRRLTLQVGDIVSLLVILPYPLGLNRVRFGPCRWRFHGRFPLQCSYQT